MPAYARSALLDLLAQLKDRLYLSAQAAAESCAVDDAEVKVGFLSNLTRHYRLAAHCNSFVLSCNLESAVAHVAAGTAAAAATHHHRTSAVEELRTDSAAAVGMTEDATAVVGSAMVDSAIHYCLPTGCGLPFCDSISFVLVEVYLLLQFLSSSNCLKAAGPDLCDRLQDGL